MSDEKNNCDDDFEWKSFAKNFLQNVLKDEPTLLPEALKEVDETESGSATSPDKRQNLFMEITLPRNIQTDNGVKKVMEKSTIIYTRKPINITPMSSDKAAVILGRGLPASESKGCNASSFILLTKSDI